MISLALPVLLTLPFLLTDFASLITVRAGSFSTVANALQQTVNSTIELQEVVLLVYLVLSKRVDFAWLKAAFSMIPRTCAYNALQVILLIL